MEAGAGVPMAMKKKVMSVERIARCPDSFTEALDKDVFIIYECIGPQGHGGVHCGWSSGTPPSDSLFLNWDRAVTPWVDNVGG